MKKMKSMLSLILAMVMVFAMTIPAFADDSYTITITNPNDNTNGTRYYEAYQIFKGDLYEDPETGDKVLSNIEWGKNVDAETIVQSIYYYPYRDEIATKLGDFLQLAGDETAAELAEKIQGWSNNEKNLKLIARAFANNLVTNEFASSSYDSDNEVYSINVDEPGYYLIKDTNVDIASNDSISEYILEVVADVDVEAKSDVISVDKTVLDDEDGSTYSDTADYDIGDDVPFKITVDLPNNVSAYDVYKLSIWDTMSKGLTYNEDIKIYVDDTEVASDNYTVTVSGTDATTIIAAFNDIKVLKDSEGNAITIAEDSEIIAKYTAELNENAVIGGNGNDNSAYVSYSSDPNSSGQFLSTSDSVRVFTYKLVVNKVGEDGKTALSGAQFTLEKWDATNSNYVEISTTTTNDATVFTFTGLDEGTYRLTESTTPAGYNTMEPIVFDIEAVTELDTTDNTFKITSLAGTDQAEEATFTADTTAGSLTTTIINYEGTILPSTGGMGTTVIYIVGAVLVLGAAVVLITRRRVNSK